MPMYWTFNCFLGFNISPIPPSKWLLNLEFWRPKKRTKLPELGFHWGLPLRWYHAKAYQIHCFISGEKSAFSLHVFHMPWRHCARYGWSDGLYLQDAGFVLAMKNCDYNVFTHYVMIVTIMVMTKWKGWNGWLISWGCRFCFWSLEVVLQLCKMGTTKWQNDDGDCAMIAYIFRTQVIFVIVVKRP